MRIAIVGCGQLSRMLALAGLPLGLKFSFIADGQGEDTVCVEGLGIIARWTEGQSIQQLYGELGSPNCITIEKEQVDLKLLQELANYCPVMPNLKAIAHCQHRYREKQLLERLAIPSADFVYNSSAKEALQTMALPMMVKSSSEGYDGKNQWLLTTTSELEEFDCKRPTQDYIIEAWVPFNKEVSQVSVRSANGEVQHYPLTENVHHNGILTHSVAPAKGIDSNWVVTAQDYMSRILNTLDYVGVMAMECFVTDTQLLVNELAPRVHNSGHWTQLGSITCQFENHVRAISNLRLGSTAQHGVSGMLNLIGHAKPPLDSLSDRSTLHWYNKSVRPGRKLGHINFIDLNYENLTYQMNCLQEKLASTA